MSVNPMQSESNLSAPKALRYGILFSLLFTGVIWLTGDFVSDWLILPDKPEPFWYEWQLPNPSFWTRATAWGGYLLHQVTLWGLIYYAQSRKLRYSKSLHWVNVWALVANAFFIVLHLVQSIVWYDGLAQDVPEQSSQWSVIGLLVIVLLMENQRRGLFFGRKIPMWQDVTQAVRKYHGYYFSWAIVYTFWFHPMVATSGHLIGFFYMFLLLLQGSLFFTRIHINRWWMLTQEVFVLFHAVMVAVMQGNDIWPMFFFGFFGLFVVTQMHGVPLKRWMHWGFLALYVGLALLVYSERGWSALNEVLRIPLAEYGVMLAIALVVVLLIRIVGRLRPSVNTQEV